MAASPVGSHGPPRRRRTRGPLSGLWDELEAWFAADDFRGSFVANAATEAPRRARPPAQAQIAQHRQALRQLLEDLAKAAGAYDPAVLAAQLQILVDGAISAASVDHDPTATAGARALATAAITHARPTDDQSHRSCGRPTHFPWVGRARGCGQPTPRFQPGRLRSPTGGLRPGPGGWKRALHSGVDASRAIWVRLAGVTGRSRMAVDPARRQQLDQGQELGGEDGWVASTA